MTARRLIVGLGNPGPDYRDTRHNLGFRLVDRLVARRGLVEATETCRSRVWLGQELAVAQPQTYMNRSGWAVECLLATLGIEREALLVAYDDVALPLGSLRLRARGGPGGHRGLESVLDSLRSDEVPRLRMGIAPVSGVEPIEDLPEFVLSAFEEGELGVVDALLARAGEAAVCWQEAGIDAAMRSANG